MSQTRSSGLLPDRWLDVFIPLALSAVLGESQIVSENISKPTMRRSVCVHVCMCVHPCPTLSVWALQPGSAGSRGLAPRQVPPECDCRQPRWCSCPEAPSIHSLTPYCPGAPGAQSLMLSEGTQSFSLLKWHSVQHFPEATERMMRRLI